MIKLLLLQFALLSFTLANTTRPVIGILTMPSEEDEYPAEKYSYLPSSYVK